MPSSWKRPLSPGGTTALSYQDIVRQKQEEQRKAEEQKRLLSQQAANEKAGNDFDPNYQPKETDLYNLADPRNDWKKHLDAAEFERRRDTERHNKERAEKRAARNAKSKRPPAVIPWKLLDALEGEKFKWASEKAHLEFRKEQAATKNK